jgi:hypothetical protein
VFIWTLCVLDKLQAIDASFLIEYIDRVQANHSIEVRIVPLYVLCSDKTMGDIYVKGLTCGYRYGDTPAEIKV